MGVAVGGMMMGEVVEKRMEVLEEEKKGVIMGGSIAQRRAAKFGFNAAGISSTALFRADALLSSPTARSPRLTIPPGISPTALLDSPVMLPNSQAQPSPTTGTLPLSPLNRGGSILHLVDSIGERNTCNDVISSFMFTPHCLQASTTDFQFLPETYKESITSHHPTTDFPFLPDIQKESNTYSNIEDNHYSLKDPTYIRNGNITTPEIFTSNIPGGIAPQQQQQKNHAYREDLTSDTMEVDQRDAYLLLDHPRASDDGFNWRKYGQKHVKGSEFPRSYYKCTHPNCQVKKKVERSRNGEITEITYKGSHEHPKPRLSRPMVGSGLSLNDMIDVGEGRAGNVAKPEGWPFFGRIHSGSREVICGSDGKVEGLELTSSTSVVTDISDPATQIKAMGVFESVETPEFSSTLATSHDDDGDRGDDEDRFTQGSVSLADEADEDELESKRRRTESCLMETSLATRAIREPRVVVQIESDIDILDDGYRWRKYGQKVVKGNPNPRSYYKCTSVGCSVRKHVERASHDLKCVITTYEGKHNHEVPAARSSGGGGGQVGPSAGGLGPCPPRSGIPYPHHHLLPHLGTGPEFGDLMRVGLLESLGQDMMLRTPPAYQVTMNSSIGYPPLPQMFPPLPLPPHLFNFSGPTHHLPGPSVDPYLPKIEHDMADPSLSILEPPPPLLRRFT